MKWKFFNAKVPLKFGFLEIPPKSAILMIFVSVYFPHIPVSNAENPRSIVTAVLEIFQKHSCSFYFGGDSNSIMANT
jgi:hypothetical protein